MPMHFDSTGKPTGAPVWLIVKGVVLIVTGFLAATGMTFVCEVGYGL